MGPAPSRLVPATITRDAIVVGQVQFHDLAGNPIDTLYDPKTGRVLPRAIFEANNFDTTLYRSPSDINGQIGDFFEPLGDFLVGHDNLGRINPPPSIPDIWGEIKMPLIIVGGIVSLVLLKDVLK